MSTKTKNLLLRWGLITYMVGVALFAYVVLSTPPDVEAQCRNITCCSANATGCCASGGTGSVYTGSRYGGPHWYSEICIN